jgi:photosystem II stability/assembly factor-like uncharacterized protein
MHFIKSAAKVTFGEIILIMTKKRFSLVILLILFISPLLKAQTIISINSNKQVSFRGLSVVDNNTAWVSGSKGTIGITNDGGKSWNWVQVKNYEKADFRDIEAFSDKEAIIMSSGSPSLILKTLDGGLNWSLKYQKDDKSYFLDAMDFADNKNGYILGDPINSKFFLLATHDAGNTWTEVADSPGALPNEAAFAASGTCIRVNNNITIVTGGSTSRMLYADTKKMLWANKQLPLTNATPSRGAFSFATNKNSIIIVGGNYSKDTQRDSVAYLLSGRGFKGSFPNSGPAGYQSCVEHLKGNVFVSTGTSGSNITLDKGKTWHKFDSNSYNVCRKAKHGNLVLLAGDKGKIGIFKF